MHVYKFEDTQTHAYCSSITEPDPLARPYQIVPTYMKDMAITQYRTSNPDLDVAVRVASLRHRVPISFSIPCVPQSQLIHLDLPQL
jgi:hypothetical protein